MLQYGVKVYKLPINRNAVVSNLDDLAANHKIEFDGSNRGIHQFFGNHKDLNASTNQAKAMTATTA